MTNFVRSTEASVRTSLAGSILGLTMFLASPIVAAAQMPVALTRITPIPTARLLVNGVVAPVGDPAQSSAKATPPRRTRLIIGGSFLGALVGGTYGYREARNFGCVDFPCPSNVGEHTLKMGAIGAVLGGITGLLVSRL